MQSARAADGERRVALDQWDIDGWQMLAAEAEKLPFSEAKPIFERLVTQFPPVGRFWKSYAEKFVAEDSSDPEMVKALYERAVQASPTSIELWKSYVTYSSSLAIKVPGSKLETDAITVHEKALTAAGLDLNANSLWSHYIDFLKNHATLSDNQRRDAVRRVYQRAVRNPMLNLDSFWREYSTFEQTANSNKELGRGFITENQPKNIDARAEFRARRSRREGLTLSALPVPPSRGRAKESSQAQQWRRFIAHERSNPNSLSDADLSGRVIHAFETALGPLYRCPDVWIEYLSYVYASFTKNGQSAPQKPSGKGPSNNAREDMLKKALAALEPLLVRGMKALPDSVGLHCHVNWIYVRLGNAAKGISALESLSKRHPSPLAFIHLMCATRKKDGKEAGRKVFAKARKEPRANHPTVYAAAALMEFTMGKESKIAKNVFELGLKNNPESAILITEFVNWLWGVGDLEQARVVLNKYTPKAKGTTNEVSRLWERWLELEETIGDANSVDLVESMWQDAGKTSTVVQDVLRRTRFMGMEGLNEEDIAAIDGVRTSAAEKSTGASGTATGKRDPRTGRRVPSSGANKDASTNGGVIGRRSGDAGSHSTPLQTATEWLHRMAAFLPHIASPPPAPDVIFRLVAETPATFGETPAGKRAPAISREPLTNEEGAVVGKKRKGEDLAATEGAAGTASAATGHAAPTQDIFRARQVAKQSRLR